MTAIEDARAALASWVSTEEPTYPELSRNGWALYEALSALTTPPTDEEMEPLTVIIRDSIERWGDLFPTPDVARYVADDVEAAGFRRQGPITDVWEYGSQITNGTIAPEPFDDLHDASVAASRWINGSVVRRRKAGPWEPVETDAG